MGGDFINNQNNTEKRKGFYQAAYIFMVIATVVEGLLLIPLAWCIPMTCATKKAYEEVGTVNEQSHLCLAIMSWLFVSVIGGALMLIAELLFPKTEQVELEPTK